MKRIKLTQNQYTLVDDEDFDELNKHKWYARYNSCMDSFYASRNDRKVNGKRFTVQMHRVILNTPKGMQTDHANHDSLDNRKVNLRICTRSQNQHNRVQHKNMTSKYKGVYWNKKYEKWRARIRINGKQIHIGYFKTEIDAGKAYDKVAMKYFGEFVCTNLEKGIL